MEKKLCLNSSPRGKLPHRHLLQRARDPIAHPAGASHRSAVQPAPAGRPPRSEHAAHLSAAIPLHPAGCVLHPHRCSPALVWDTQRRAWSRRSPSPLSPGTQPALCRAAIPRDAHRHRALCGAASPRGPRPPRGSPRGSGRAAAAPCLPRERDSRAEPRISRGSLTLRARGQQRGRAGGARGAGAAAAAG